MKVSECPSSWPIRLNPEHGLNDQDWARLQRRCGLHDRNRDGIDCRALLEREIRHAQLSISEARRAPRARDVRNQLGRIARSRLGRELPRPLIDEVVGLLAGMSMTDPALSECLPDAATHLASVRDAMTVTSELKLWAKWCLALGAGRRGQYLLHGGGANISELVFISVLLNFWSDILDRPATQWIGEKFGERRIVGTGRRATVERVRTISAAPRTVFAAECLMLAGARATDGGELTLEHVHHRIRRVETEMKRAIAMGLGANVLARRLNA